MAKVQAYTKSGVDAKFNSRSNMTMVHNGGGSPDISAYPDSKTGDVIERASDGARWSVVASTITPIAGRVLSVAGKAGHITLGPGDVGAAPTSHTHTKAQITDLNASTSATANSIAQRGTSGVLAVGRPTSDTHAATKAYVDDKVADPVLSTRITTEDLNDLETPGNYTQSTNANATEDRNYPVASRAGHLTVSRSSGFVSQEYADYMGNAQYFRTKYNGTWYPWRTIATRNWVDTAVTAGKAWTAITGKPSTFPPSTHTHTVSQISDLTLAVAADNDTVAKRDNLGRINVSTPTVAGHAATKKYVDDKVASPVSWANLSGKPSTFTPSTHSHTQAQVTGLPAKLTTFDAAAAKVNAITSYVSGSTTNAAQLLALNASGRLTAVNPTGTNDVANKQYVDSRVGLYTTWDNTTGKPSTFPPSAHKHTVADVTGLTLSQTATGSTVAQRDSSGRVTVGTPSATGHATTKAYVDNAVTAGKAWSAITGKPAIFPPTWHTHTISEISDLTVSTSGDVNTVVKRDDLGRIMVSEPAWHNHATNKRYVDNAIAAPVNSTNLTTEDLDDVVAPGNYIQRSNSDATNGRNYPGEGRAGYLTVYREQGYVAQEYTDYMSNGKYFRTKYNDEWFSWRIIATRTYVDNAITAGNTWASITGKPSAYTPSTHTHTVAQITNLPAVVTTVTNNAIVQRTVSGQVIVPNTPSNTQDATSKQYVDAKFVSTSLSTQNLNDVTTPGNHIQPTNSNATEGRNYPPGARAGHLFVMNSDIYTKQEYTDYLGEFIYYRTKHFDAWTPWRSISQTTL